MDHEQRRDEIRRCQLVFADELAYCAGTATAAGTVGRREAHEGRLESGRPARNGS